nr:MAG TPA: hypothetical protein [Caudoviricetes sp.]
MIEGQLTAFRRRSLFQCVVYRSLAPIIDLLNTQICVFANFRHKKTAMLSGAGYR